MLSLGVSDLCLNRLSPPRGFELQVKLEEGATSVVYKAQNRELRAVLKVYKSGFECFAEQILTHLANNNVPGISAREKVGPLIALGAHGVGVTHRDIRPENIIMDSSGVVRLIDWGGCHDWERTRTTGSR